MATVPVTRTFVAGEVVTAPHFNDNIRDPLNFLLAPPILEVRNITTAQSISDNTWTPFTFNTEDVDSSGMHSTSSNTSRATAVYPGWYQFSGATSFEANSTGQRGARWAKNGTELDGGEALAIATSSFAPSIVARTKQIFLNVNDYVELQGYQNRGSALNSSILTTTQAGMSARWVSN